MSTHQSQDNRDSEEARALTKHRTDIIDCLIYPRKTLCVGTGDTQVDLSAIAQRNPERLKAIGLTKETFFSPTCVDPSRGSWIVGRFSVWIDSETAQPVDARTVKVLDQLPDAFERLPSPKLLDLLAPTYLRSEEDAAALTELLNLRGPSSSWIE